MKEQFTSMLYEHAIDPWIQKHAHVLVERIESERVRLKAGYRARNEQIPLQLSPFATSLSEVQACRAVIQIPPPFGFRLVRPGTLYVEPEEWGHHIIFPHYYYVGPMDTIFDISVGQVIQGDDEELLAGERLAVLFQNAPLLMHMHDRSRGLASIYGSRGQIDHSLRLLYCDSRPSEIWANSD